VLLVNFQLLFHNSWFFTYMACMARMGSGILQPSDHKGLGTHLQGSQLKPGGKLSAQRELDNQEK
jgi:hypothetical protein